VSNDRYWREERVQRGDTIGSLLARAAVDDSEAIEFLRTEPARLLPSPAKGPVLKSASSTEQVSLDRCTNPNVPGVCRRSSAHGSPSSS
jgi:hypothetical protein